MSKPKSKKVSKPTASPTTAPSNKTPKPKPPSAANTTPASAASKLAEKAAASAPPAAPPTKPFNPDDYVGRIIDITFSKSLLEGLGAPNVPAPLKGSVILRFVDAKMEHRAPEPRLVVSYVMEKPMLAVVEPPKK